MGTKPARLFIFGTESFTLSEMKFLINILSSKFDLECSIHKVTNGYRIYIHSTSKNKLINLVQPYFVKHFYYKLDLDKDS